MEEANKQLIRDLKEGRKKVGVWGIGYIGYSTMAHFAREGVHCIGYDAMPQRVDDVNEGREAIPNMDRWLGFDVKPFIKAGVMNATSNWKELVSNDVPVHMVCIPTEKDGKPLCRKALRMVHPSLSGIKTYTETNCRFNIVERYSNI